MSRTPHPPVSWRRLGTPQFHSHATEGALRGKKRGPKRRLIEEPGDDLPSLPHTTRLSEPAPAFISESSEDDDEDDDDDEELRSRSPPVLTKPTLGLKCKV